MMADRLRALVRSPGGRLGLVVAVLLAVTAGGVVAWRWRRLTPAPAAVVLVTVDTLRADAVPFTDGEPNTAPFLAHLAERGIVFREAYAPSSWTPPSMASLFTGLFPTSHGITQGVVVDGTVHRQRLLPASLVTLAEVFREAGYVTIGVPANRHLAAGLGFAQGFDYYAGADFMDARAVNEQVEKQMRRAFGADWLTAWKHRKAFLWIHYFDPHDPYFAREPWISRRAPDFTADAAAYPQGLAMRDLKQRYPQPDGDAAAHIRPLYESEVSYFDHYFQLLGERLGLEDDNVLFIFTSDHGEEIVEHGGLGHSTTLYQELVHVPLLIRWPAVFTHAAVTDVPVSTVDLYPTLADLLGLGAPPSLQGASFAPLLYGETGSRSRPVYFELHKRRNPAKAIRDGEWKLVRTRRPPRVQLFNLATDPHEQHDVAAEQHAIVERLAQSLTRWVASLPPPPDDQQTRELDDDATKEQLRALGYLD